MRFNQLSVQTAYMVHEGTVQPRSGEFKLPRLSWLEQFNPLLPLEVQGARRNDLVYFVRHKQNTHPMYVSEITWNGIGTLVSGNLLHAWPAEYIRPHIREMVTQLLPGELEQFGADVQPLLAHVGIRGS